MRSKIVPPAGAVVGMDALSAARRAGLDEVSYSARKPPATCCARCDGPGNALDEKYAATVALTGVGFAPTRVWIVAAPKTSENIHK